MIDVGELFADEKELFRDGRLRRDVVKLLSFPPYLGYYIAILYPSDTAIPSKRVSERDQR
jgi:hypothetical protein